MYSFFFGDGIGREILRTLVPSILILLLGAWMNRKEKRRDIAIAERREKEKKEEEQKAEVIKQEMAKKEEEQRQRDNNFVTLLANNTKISCATLKFCVAIGDAVETGKVNGTMKKAREYAEKLTADQTDFLADCAVNGIIKK